ncbi:hypothetical protein AURDEDRAFT_177526 [Auricularia subglabra TFB-10046 SS5]|uniref:Uncharacterized protein n=1 Tax=Auricularia subglabra (strain TFB-10046 / SS5) TaxID=717982 RepID=J0D3X4_AURST|nr:hypothetical protein AURDEDRAFT_177526 [Auricularia subglabra TFB-10046 SS5]
MSSRQLAPGLAVLAQSLATCHKTWYASSSPPSANTQTSSLGFRYSQSNVLAAERLVADRGRRIRRGFATDPPSQTSPSRQIGGRVRVVRDHRPEPDCPSGAWVATFELVDTPAELLNFPALRRCFGERTIHWDCLPSLMQMAAERIMRGISDANRSFALLLTVPANRLCQGALEAGVVNATVVWKHVAVELLTGLRLFLSAPCDTNGLRRFCSSVPILLLTPGRIVLDEHRHLHESLRHTACAAISASQPLTAWVPTLRSMYLLALAHSLAGSRDGTTSF